MNFGPLEFAAYLRLRGLRKKVPDGTAAARGTPSDGEPVNRLTVVSSPASLLAVARYAQIEAMSVYEAIAAEGGAGEPVVVTLRPTLRPVVLVLSSHEPVEWRISMEPGATLAAILISGYGDSTVTGAGEALISSIGGFYAFKRGSAEFVHLEREVRRSTGREIENFQSVYAGKAFWIGGD